MNSFVRSTRVDSLVRPRTMLAQSSPSSSSSAGAAGAHSSPFHSPLCRCWLGRGLWYWLFLIELPICLATVLFWLIAPGGYVSGFVQGRVGGATHMETALLQQCANVVFCAYCVFYGRLLVSAPSCFSSAGPSSDPSRPATWCSRSFPHRQAFLWLQQAMGLGDGLMLLQCAYDWGYLDPKPSIIVGQVVMAGGYGLARLVFLIQQRKIESENAQLTLVSVATGAEEQAEGGGAVKIALSPASGVGTGAGAVVALPRPTPRSSHTPATIAVGAKQLRVEGEIDTPGSYQS